MSDSLRVVRCSNRTLSSDSTAAMRALTADFETPSLSAARVKDFPPPPARSRPSRESPLETLAWRFHSARASQPKRGLVRAERSQHQPEQAGGGEPTSEPNRQQHWRQQLGDDGQRSQRRWKANAAGHPGQRPLEAIATKPPQGVLGAVREQHHGQGKPGHGSRSVPSRGHEPASEGATLRQGISNRMGIGFATWS